MILTTMILASCSTTIADKKFKCVTRLVERGGVEAQKAAEVCDYTYTNAMEHVEREGKDD